MTLVVADASVALKWFFRTRRDQADVAAALALLKGVAHGGITLIQPPHFVAGVAAVLVREAPQTAAADLRDLLAVEMHTDTTDEAYWRKARGERAIVRLSDFRPGGPR